MNIVLIPVIAIFTGLLVRPHFRAALLYLAIESIVFTFQTLVVLLAWMGGEGGFGGATDQGAFGPTPTAFPVVLSETDVWMYGLVNLALITVGLGATLLIVTIRNRSRAKRDVVSVP